MNPDELRPLTEDELKREMAKTLGQQAEGDPKLAKVPDQFKQFFAGMSKGKKTDPEKLDLSDGRARPEERKILMVEGWDGVSPLPTNIADLRKNQANIASSAAEAAIKKLEQQPSITPANDLKEVPYELASPEQQRAFREMTERLEAAAAAPQPRVINTGASTSARPAPAPQPAVQPVAPAVPAKSAMSIIDQLTAEAPQPAPAPAPQQQPAYQPTAETPPITTRNSICKRCSFDNTTNFETKPTDEDIRARVLSIALSARGGDGRFRKAYSLFGGRVTVHFRELKNEGSLIYQEENDIVLSNDPEKSTLQRMFSMDRVSFRRHCCGLEKITIGDNSIDVPELSAWIEKTGGDVGKALSLLETTVRTRVYPSESILMAAGAEWANFEGVVTALWLDQSFYKGAP